MADDFGVQKDTPHSTSRSVLNFIYPNKNDKFASNSLQLVDEEETNLFAESHSVNLDESTNKKVHDKITILQDITLNKSNEIGDDNNSQEDEIESDCDSKDPVYENEEFSDETPDSDSESLVYQNETDNKRNKEKFLENQENKGRKRKRNTKMWKKSIRKDKKASGEEYLYANGKTVIPK